MSWSDEIIRESPLYNELVKEAQQQQALKMLVRTLQLRFGEVPSSVKVSLQALTIEELEDLAEESVAVNSLDEFIAAIPAETRNESELK